MKAIVYERYGPPDVLKVGEEKRPEAGEGAVLVKVLAASVNPADWHMIRGEPKFSRLSFGLLRPKNRIPGLDIAGMVVEAGSGVTGLKPGDEVFGNAGWGGGLAGYVAARESEMVNKPSNLTMEEAASVNVAGITALQGLRHKSTIRTDDKVLINGASGGVGTFAVQIAKSKGAEVTGVCSSANHELVRSIGADHTIDYTSGDFTRGPVKYDFILDAVGNRSVSDYKRALAEQGTCVIVGFTTVGRLLAHSIAGPLSSSSRGKRVLVMGTAQPNRQDLEELSALLEAGLVRPVIDRIYPFEETPEAIRYLETGRARGKVVITI